MFILGVWTSRMNTILLASERILRPWDSADVINSLNTVYMTMDTREFRILWAITMPLCFTIVGWSR